MGLTLKDLNPEPGPDEREVKPSPPEYPIVIVDEAGNYQLHGAMFLAEGRYQLVKVDEEA